MKDVPCFIIGNGPSLNDVPIQLLKNYFTIGINRSFYLIDTTILIWQDLALWLQEKKTIKKYKPKLAICIYHLPDDPEVIEKLILDYVPEYNIKKTKQKIFAWIQK